MPNVGTTKFEDSRIIFMQLGLLLVSNLV